MTLGKYPRYHLIMSARLTDALYLHKKITKIYIIRHGWYLLLESLFDPSGI